MNIIETTAPIAMDDLKQYFENKDETQYVIDYTNSTLKDEKILTYLSNLDLPADLKVSSYDEIVSLVKQYLRCNFIVNLPSLELATIDLLFQYKGLIQVQNQELLDELKEDLDVWVERLDSLSLYNVYSINSEKMREWVESHPVAENEETVGINFVSLLKHPVFYEYYQKVDTRNLKYYPKFFNEYVFKGNNIYSYWANENNPMFLLTYGIASGDIKPEEYIEAKKTSIQEMSE